MSTFSMVERENLKKFLGMGSGYVLDFSDRTFGEFVFEAVGIDIHDRQYASDGTSKAKNLLAFWKLESDHTVGTLLHALIDYGVAVNVEQTAEAKALVDFSCFQNGNNWSRWQELPDQLLQPQYHHRERKYRAHRRRNSMKRKITPPREPILLHQAEDGLIRVDVRMDGETVWLTQEQIAQWFERERSVITKHVGNVFVGGELPEDGNVQILHIAISDKPVRRLQRISRHWVFGHSPMA
ncbi:hypothetical protein [Verminephrobacter eiseniae]|uniref:hypothetical protein n=1 Tax=Verminephrobacter eiseniae TaxID=364317 RepID=UPI002238AEED|nr:hypothetical protein [Verminephrobacter eiseniae]MCW5238316.1 hypothetical protein [Verminephrobacter eiseniae]